MILRGAFLCLILTLFSASQLFAANLVLAKKFNSETGQENKEILLEGSIAKGDLKKISDILEKENGSPDGSGFDFVLVLSSLGGDFSEGLAIASFARQKNLRTVVKNGSTCASACAFAFLGGSFSEDGTYAHRTLEIGAKLQFHAPYVELGQATVNVQDLVREITNVTVELNKKFDEFQVPTAIVPLLLKNEKDHSLFNATTIEAVGLLGIRVEGFSANGPITRSIVKNRCINGWRIGMRNLPSSNWADDIQSFDSWSKESGFKLQNEKVDGTLNETVRVQAVDLGEGTSATCIIDKSAQCSFEEPDVKCDSGWDSHFLFSVPPDTELINAKYVLANYRANEVDLFESSPPKSPADQIPVPKVALRQNQLNATAFICNSKSTISNIRSGPNAKSFPIIATFANGWPITIVGTQNNPETGHAWLKVSAGNIQGFIDSDWVVSDCSTQKIANAKPVVVTICNKAADTTNLRSGPSAQSFPVIEVLRNGDKVELFYVTANPISGHPWFNIRTRTSSGYVDSEKIGRC